MASKEDGVLMFSQGHRQGLKTNKRERQVHELYIFQGTKEGRKGDPGGIGWAYFWQRQGKRGNRDKCHLPMTDSFLSWVSYSHGLMAKKDRRQLFFLACLKGRDAVGGKENRRVDDADLTETFFSPVYRNAHGLSNSLHPLSLLRNSHTQAKAKGKRNFIFFLVTPWEQTQTQSDSS